MGLFRGRHDMLKEVKEYIFDWLVNLCDLKGVNRTTSEKLSGIISLTACVTGLTLALVEVIKMCRNYSISLKLAHCNRDTDVYFYQSVFSVL